MPENEVAPCALCLQVDELPSMLEVQLPPSQGEPGLRRRLCAGCVSAIEAAMQESDRWGSAHPANKKRRVKESLVRSDPASVSEIQSPAPDQPTDQISDGGEEGAKSA